MQIAAYRVQPASSQVFGLSSTGRGDGGVATQTSRTYATTSWMLGWSKTFSLSLSLRVLSAHRVWRAWARSCTRPCRNPR